MVLPYGAIQSELEKANCWSALNGIFQTCAFVKIPEIPPQPPYLIHHRSLNACPRRRACQSAFSRRGSVESLEICGIEQLMDHRVCFISLRFTFSPGSLPQLHKRSAPGWHPRLFAWCARRCTPVSTSSAAKHFRLCKFNEQQSNSVPQGAAFSLFPFVATSTNAVVWECAQSLALLL